MIALVLAAILPFVEDDYPKAVEVAKRTRKPIVIDFWAPWCHSCLAMKSYVLTDPAVVALQHEAVFASIDTDNDKNAAVVQRFPISAWPTFLIIDPDDKHVIGRLVGSASPKDFVAFVKGATTGPFRDADRLAVEGKTDAAIASYQKALPSARAAFGIVMLQMDKGDFSGCAQTAAKYATKDSSYGLSLLAMQASCLLEAGQSASTLVEPLKQALASPLLTVDDKSDIYATLVEVQEDEARRLKQARLAMLEEAAKQAPTPEAARVFDAHRAEVYLDLGRTEDAIAMLTASEKAAPQDYNPPARLARAYLAKGDLDNAKAAIARAKTKVYGPRTAVIVTLEGEIMEKAGDKAAAQKAYQQARAVLEKQPPTAGTKRRLQGLDKKLASL